MYWLERTVFFERYYAADSLDENFTKINDLADSLKSVQSSFFSDLEGTDFVDA